MSREVSAWLDVADFGSGKYTLEVSSPGLDREFYRSEDYERFQGRQVRITWKAVDMPQKRTVVGRLRRFESSAEGKKHVEVETEDEKLSIALSDVITTRLEPEL